MRPTFLEAGVAIILLGLISVLVKAVSANAITIGVFRLAVAVVLMLTFRRTRGVGWQCFPGASGLSWC